MTLSLLATVVTSEAAAHGEGTVSVNPIWFGLGTLAIFLILVFAVTRLNLDR